MRILHRGMLLPIDIDRFWDEVNGSKLQRRGRAGQGAVTKRCLRLCWASRNADPARSRRVRRTVNECSRR